MGIRGRNLWFLAIILFPVPLGQAREPKQDENVEVAVEVYFVDLDTAAVEELKQHGLLRQQDTGKVSCILDNSQLQRFMNVVQANVSSNVIQAPKLTTLSGQTRRINVCDHQDFVTSLEIASRDGHLEFRPKTETVPLGVALKIRCVASADRRVVRTHLRASLTNLASSEVPRVPITTPAPNGETGTVTHYVEQPQIEKFAVDRKMTIPDGNTAVLMGPTKQIVGRCEYGPPILSQIPVVGRMFRSIGYHGETHQLLVLVTPRILVPQEQEKKHALQDDFRTPVLGAYREHDPHCSEAPNEGRILRALPPLKRLAGVYEESRDNVQIMTERIGDKIDPPRFFPIVGKAQLHHYQWKCSVYYQETISGNYPFCFRWTHPRIEVVSIDTDHLHLVANEKSPAK